MNKLMKTIVALFSLTLLLSSCTSIYQLPDEGTQTVNFDEYFTDGTSFYDTGDQYRGFFYEGCWFYVESQRTTGPKSVKRNAEGEIVDIGYGDITIERVVKYNPATGNVSSPCLDPNCTHSLESDCFMLAPHEVLQRSPSFWIHKIVGNWIIISIQYLDDVYVTRNEERLYNLKTGERRFIFNEDLSSSVMTRWVNSSAFEGKIYRIKQTLDYSETKFDPNRNKSVTDFAPKTVNTLCEYDIEKDKLTELFEIPDGYRLSAVTNKRFFFLDDTSAHLSCNRDGSNMKKEKVYPLHSNSIGNLQFSWDDNGFIVYDVIKNKIKTVTAEFDEYKGCAPAEGGILFDHLVGYDKYTEFLNTREEFYEQHQELSLSEKAELFSTAATSYLADCTSRIYRTDYYGENMELLYEEENAVIYSVYASEEYIFAVRAKPPAESEKCVINIETGEVTELPLLDVVVPPEYLN